MKLSHALYASVATVLISASAMAEGMSTQKAQAGNLPEMGKVQLSGQVKEVDNEKEFTLSDATGEVEINTANAINLEEGDQVIVIGHVNKGALGTEIDQAEVQFVTNSAAGGTASSPAASPQ